MPTMTYPTTASEQTYIEVTGGVDTHKDTHTVAALDASGRLLGHREFAATAAGYAALLAWLGTLGQLVRVGVEGRDLVRGQVPCVLADARSGTGLRELRGRDAEREAVHDPIADRLYAFGTPLPLRLRRHEGRGGGVERPRDLRTPSPSALSAG